MGEVRIKPVINKRNGQINLSIPKNKFPKNIRDKFPQLKMVKLNRDCFDFI